MVTSAQTVSDWMNQPLAGADGWNGTPGTNAQVFQYLPNSERTGILDAVGRGQAAVTPDQQAYGMRVNHIAQNLWSQGGQAADAGSQLISWIQQQYGEGRVPDAALTSIEQQLANPQTAGQLTAQMVAPIQAQRLADRERGMMPGGPPIMQSPGQPQPSGAIRAQSLSSPQGGMAMPYYQPPAPTWGQGAYAPPAPISFTNSYMQPRQQAAPMMQQPLGGSMFGGAPSFGQPSPYGMGSSYNPYSMGNPYQSMSPYGGMSNPYQNMASPYGMSPYQGMGNPYQGMSPYSMNPYQGMGNPYQNMGSPFSGGGSPYQSPYSPSPYGGGGLMGPGGPLSFLSSFLSGGGGGQQFGGAPTMGGGGSPSMGGSYWQGQANSSPSPLQLYQGYLAGGGAQQNQPAPSTYDQTPGYWTTGLNGTVTPTDFSSPFSLSGAIAAQQPTAGYNPAVNPYYNPNSSQSLQLANLGMNSIGYSNQAGWYQPRQPVQPTRGYAGTLYSGQGAMGNNALVGGASYYQTSGDSPSVMGSGSTPQVGSGSIGPSGGQGGGQPSSSGMFGNSYYTPYSGGY